MALQKLGAVDRTGAVHLTLENLHEPLPADVRNHPRDEQRGSVAIPQQSADGHEDHPDDWKTKCRDRGKNTVAQWSRVQIHPLRGSLVDADDWFLVQHRIEQFAEHPHHAPQHGDADGGV